MPFDIENLNPPERFYYPGSPDEWVEFIVLNAVDIEAIEKETVKHRVEYVQPKRKNGKPDMRKQLQRIEYDEDSPDRQDIIACASIHAWHLVTPDGDDIPCTDETKLNIVRGSVEFNTFMAGCLETMQERKDQRDKDLEKN